MKKILVGASETAARGLVAQCAAAAGCQVFQALDAETALDLCKWETFDLVLLDDYLPRMEALSVCRRIRAFSHVPIILLSDKAAAEDRIFGFQAGADDYLTKPFSPEELTLRIQSILKRTQPVEFSGTRDVFRFRGLTVDFTSRTVNVDGKDVPLSPKEFELLRFFILRQGIALKRDQLLSHAWGQDYTGNPRTLDTHIKLLRKRLGPYGRNIVTLRGVGYRFVMETDE